MKKYLLLFAAAAAAVTIVSCGKDNKDKEVPENAESAKKALIAYLPLNDANNVIATGEGFSVVGLGGAGEFNASGFKGGCYNNSSADIDAQAYLKLNVPEKFLSGLTSFTFSAWINSPAQRGGIITFDGGEDANWGAWDLFFDGGDTEAGTILKGYFYNQTTLWKGFYPSYQGLEVALNKWIQLVYSYDEKTSHANLYVNGALVGPVNEETGEIEFTSDCYAQDVDKDGNQPKVGALHMPKVSCMYIGAFASRETGKSSEGWLSYFAGKVDEIHIYNRALTSKEVLAVYKDEVLNSDLD